jgi:hypothetical protein
MVTDLFELSRIHASALNLDLQEIPLGTSSAMPSRRRSRSARPRASWCPVSSRWGAHGARQRPGAEPGHGEPAVERIRHTPAGGEVRVTSHIEGGEVVVGRCRRLRRHRRGGPPSPVRGRLPRQRGTHTRARRRSGTGARHRARLVEAHGGTLGISNHGPGCCAAVRLPAVQDDVPVPVPLAEVDVS